MAHTAAKRSHLHCALGARSWTDNATNLTLLAGVDLKDHLAAFTRLGKFPHKSLPAFLHESVHHWCFLSPVGSTLALLQLRARRNVLVHASGEREMDSLDIVDDVIKYETAIELLRPLAEGLALFAEFDVTPRPDSGAMSVPFRWLYVGYTAPDKAELESDFGLSLFKLIWNMRQHDIYVERKLNVLLQGLGHDQGGYLTGYMLVKNMWQLAARGFPAFIDRDLFMMFLRHYFYDDLGFVNLLLDDDVHDIEAGNAIGFYVQERLKSFLLQDFSVNGARFVDSVINSKNTAGIDLKTLEGATDRGAKRLLQEVMALQAQPRESLEGVLKSMDAHAMAQRDILCLGSADVEIKILKSGFLWIACDDNPIGAFHPNSGEFGIVAPSGGPATLDIYISPSGLSMYRVIALSQGSNVVCFFPIGDMPVEIRSQFRSYVANRAAHDSFHNSRRLLLEAFLAQDDVARLLVEHGRSTRGTGVDEVFLPLSLPLVADEDLQKYVEQTRDLGLLHFVGGDERVLRSLVKIGLIASLTYSREDIASLLRRDKSLPADILERLVTLGDACNVPFIQGNEDVLVVTP